MNILNILGIVPASQKNVVAGQGSFPAAPTQSLFLPMLLQFFAGNATKSETIPFSQVPLNGTAQPNIESPKNVKPSTNRPGDTNDSAGTGLDFLANQIARFGSVFATLQNVKFSDGIKNTPLGNDALGGVDSNEISSAQVLGRGGANVAPAAVVQDPFASVPTEGVSVPTISVQQTSVDVLPSVLDVPSSGSITAASVPPVVTSYAASNGTLPLAGFELTKRVDPPAIFPQAESHSAAEVMTEPALSELPSEAGNVTTLAPITNVTAVDGYDLIGMRQAAVGSVDPSTKLQHTEIPENTVLNAKETQAASLLSSKPSVRFSESGASTLQHQDNSVADSEAIVKPFTMPSPVFSKPAVQPDSPESSAVVPAIGTAPKTVVFASPSSMSPAPLPKPADQLSGVSSIIIIPPSEGTGETVGSALPSLTISNPVPPSVMPGIKSGEAESHVGAQDGDSNAAVENTMRRYDMTDTPAKINFLLDQLGNNTIQASPRNMNQADNIPVSLPGPLVKPITQENILTSKIIVSQPPEIPFSNPEGSLMDKGLRVSDSNVGQSHYLGIKDAAAIPVDQSNVKGSVSGGKDLDYIAGAKVEAGSLRTKFMAESEVGSEKNPIINEQVQPRENSIPASPLKSPSLNSTSPLESMTPIAQPTVGEVSVDPVPDGIASATSTPSETASSILPLTTKPADVMPASVVQQSIGPMTNEIKANPLPDRKVNTASTAFSPAKDVTLKPAASVEQSSVDVPPPTRDVSSADSKLITSNARAEIGQTSLDGESLLVGAASVKGIEPSATSPRIDRYSSTAVEPKVSFPEMPFDNTEKILAPALAANANQSGTNSAFGLRQSPVRLADSSITAPQSQSPGKDSVTLKSSPATTSSSQKPAASLSEVVPTAPLPQEEGTDNFAAIASSLPEVLAPSPRPLAATPAPFSKTLVQSGETKPRVELATNEISPSSVTPQDNLPSLPSPLSPLPPQKTALDHIEQDIAGSDNHLDLGNSLTQTGSNKNVVETKASVVNVEKNTDQSQAPKLDQAQIILPSETGGLFKAAARENESRTVGNKGPQILSSLPAGSLSPRTSVIGDRTAAQSELPGRRDANAAPVNHPDDKGKPPRGQESDLQGAAKGEIVTLHETVKTNSQTGSGKDSGTNEQFQPQGKIAETPPAATDSDPLQSSADDTVTKTAAVLPAMPNGNTKNVPIAATQAELLAKMANQLSGIHNSQLTVPRQESSGQSTASVPTTQTGLMPGNLEQMVLDQVSKNLVLNLNNNSSEVRIAMKPESLGEVVMKVKMDDGKVSAQINVNNINVKAVLDANVAQLHETLLSKGIEVQHIEIIADGQTAFGSSSGQNNPKQKSQQRSAAEVDALGQYDSLRTMGYNTIELIM